MRSRSFSLCISDRSGSAAPEFLIVIPPKARRKLHVRHPNQCVHGFLQEGSEAVFLSPKNI